MNTRDIATRAIGGIIGISGIAQVFATAGGLSTGGLLAGLGLVLVGVILFLRGAWWRVETAS